MTALRLSKLTKFLSLQIAGISLLLLCSNLPAQQISFSFTANHSCEYAALDSVFIQNITAACDTTLYWNDTTINFDFTAIEPLQNLPKKPFEVFCYPNPFESQTCFVVNTVKHDNLFVSIFDITGRLLASTTVFLKPGKHSFDFCAAQSNHYILKISSSEYSENIHLIQTSGNNRNTVSLTYNGPDEFQETGIHSKSVKSNFTYSIGNQLMYTGFAHGDYDVITDAPTESFDYTFNINTSAPGVPEIGELTPELNQITWNWTAVDGATAYYWNFTDNFETATDIGNTTSLVCDNLYCGTEYSIFIWAGNHCGHSEPIMLTQETSFACGCTFADNRDANTYQTVQIGSQCWMAENMAYLPLVHTDAEFQSLGSWIQRAYGVYGYNGSDVELAKAHENYALYGVIYNWWAAMDGYVGSSTNPSGLQGICPKGWHVPGDDEWKQLEGEVDATYPYGDPEWDLQWFRGNDAGSALAGNAPLWADDNLINHSSFNSSGFNILPGGQRDQWGNSIAIGGHTYLWSATESGQPSAWVRAIYYDDPSVYRNPVNKQWGFYVRCVRN